MRGLFAVARLAEHRELEETHMRAEILTVRKYCIYWYLKLRRTVRLHLESSLKLSREEADVFVTRLRQTSSGRAPKQIRDGQEKKIVNFKTKCAAQKTIQDLPMLLSTPQEHWFQKDVEGISGRMRRSSNSHIRLQALAVQMNQQSLHEVDIKSEPAGECL